MDTKWFGSFGGECSDLRGFDRRFEYVVAEKAELEAANEYNRETSEVFEVHFEEIVEYRG